MNIRKTAELLLTVEQLENIQTQEAYSVAVHNRFDVLAKTTYERTPDEVWSKIKEVVTAAANEVLTKASVKKQSWIKEETFELMQKKKAAKRTNGERYMYEQLKTEVQRQVRR